MTEQVTTFTASVSIAADTARLTSLVINNRKTAPALGRVTLQNLTAAGSRNTTLLTINTIPQVPFTHTFPNGGIKFDNGIFVSVGTSVTGFATFV